MYAVRCAANQPGFRANKTFFHSNKWTLIEELHPEIENEPMLEVLECKGADDPVLYPFPVLQNDFEIASVSPAELQSQIAELQSQITELKAQIEALTAAKTSAK